MSTTNEQKYLENKVVIMNGFTHEEIHRVMRAVKQEFEAPRDLIFAMTTEQSLEMKLKDLIVDMSEDHEYLRKNPPKIKSAP
ncbi:DUF3783 domain-containing protein [Spirochaeta africana]|uniref:DUF3783 domain-containing protein n=1 Tax=Spirochaeta africana (strain ATCC 700263 / DSM 8902 / Z-7692) TaxID=889378 RepID=H9UHS0_SPIAZ|nr:DUF3783 domain-containing protein [Spirochaeta africana]AFG37063.1 hypothetical protein Spiaf_0975 [Spirochaeta africana DSM 8902]